MPFSTARPPSSATCRARRAPARPCAPASTVSWDRAGCVAASASRTNVPTSAASATRSVPPGRGARKPQCRPTLRAGAARLGDRRERQQRRLRPTSAPSGVSRVSEREHQYPCPGVPLPAPLRPVEPVPLPFPVGPLREPCGERAQQELEIERGDVDSPDLRGRRSRNRLAPSPPGSSRGRRRGRSRRTRGCRAASLPARRARRARGRARQCELRARPRARHVERVVEPRRHWRPSAEELDRAPRADVVARRRASVRREVAGNAR